MWGSAQRADSSNVRRLDGLGRKGGHHPISDKISENKPLLSKGYYFNRGKKAFLSLMQSWELDAYLIPKKNHTSPKVHIFTIQSDSQRRYSERRVLEQIRSCDFSKIVTTT